MQGLAHTSTHQICSLQGRAVWDGRSPGLAHRQQFQVELLHSPHPQRPPAQGRQGQDAAAAGRQDVGEQAAEQLAVARLQHPHRRLQAVGVLQVHACFCGQKSLCARWWLPASKFSSIAAFHHFMQALIK